MPIYEYCCQDCQHVFEEWQKDFKEREMTCPVCGSPAKRLISNTSFILKGSGWYVTDYANNKASTKEASTNDNNKEADANTKDNGGKETKKEQQDSSKAQSNSKEKKNGKVDSSSANHK